MGLLAKDNLLAWTFEYDYYLKWKILNGLGVVFELSECSLSPIMFEMNLSRSFTVRSGHFELCLTV